MRINQAYTSSELSVNPPRIYIDYKPKACHGSMMYADGMGRLHLSLRMSTVCVYLRAQGWKERLNKRSRVRLQAGLCAIFYGNQDMNAGFCCSC